MSGSEVDDEVAGEAWLPMIVPGDASSNWGKQSRRYAEISASLVPPTPAKKKQMSNHKRVRRPVRSMKLSKSERQRKQAYVTLIYLVSVSVDL